MNLLRLRVATLLVMRRRTAARATAGSQMDARLQAARGSAEVWWMISVQRFGLRTVPKISWYDFQFA